MITERELFAEIKAHPEDDRPRMLYADLMEEEGRQDRADFIRIQIELAGMACCVHGFQAWAREWGVGHDCKYCSLKKREEKLKETGAPHGWFSDTWQSPFATVVSPEIEIENLIWQRGFIEGVRCSWPGWRMYASRLIEKYPIQFVRLTTTPQFNIEWEPRRDEINRTHNRTMTIRIRECARVMSPGLEILRVNFCVNLAIEEVEIARDRGEWIDSHRAKCRRLVQEKIDDLSFMGEPSGWWAGIKFEQARTYGMPWIGLEHGYSYSAGPAPRNPMQMRRDPLIEAEFYRERQDAMALAMQMNMAVPTNWMREQLGLGAPMVSFNPGLLYTEWRDDDDQTGTS